MEQQSQEEDQNNIETCYIWETKLKIGKNTICVGFQNDKNKAEEIKTCINKMKFDTFCLAEINANWRKIPQQSNIWNRTRG